MSPYSTWINFDARKINARLDEGRPIVSRRKMSKDIYLACGFAGCLNDANVDDKYVSRSWPAGRSREILGNKSELT
jgi:hypothetical protein